MRKMFIFMFSIFVVLAGVSPSASAAELEIDFTGCFMRPSDTVLQAFLDAKYVSGETYVYAARFSEKEDYSEVQCTLIVSPKPLKGSFAAVVFQWGQLEVVAQDSSTFDGYYLDVYDETWIIEPTEKYVPPMGHYMSTASMTEVKEGGETDPAAPPTNEDYDGWFGGIVQAVKELPQTILGFLKDLFIPKDTVFTDFYNGIKGKLEERFDMTPITTALEQVRDTQGGTFTDIKVGGFKIGGVQFPEMTVISAKFVNDALPEIHTFVRGLAFFLLLLAFLNDAYRLIRNTSLYDVTTVTGNMDGEGSGSKANIRARRSGRR